MARIDENKILITGGSGRLGTEFKKLLPKALYPSSKEFEVSNTSKTWRYVQKHKPHLIIHAAAFTSPPLVDKNPVAAISTNIIGTANIAKICSRMRITLVYVSTDYVFKGDKGGYKEEDPIYPVNKYAWSKLGGECAVRLLDDYLIIRTSFGEKEFPYDKAFFDHYTSRERVDIVAEKIVAAIKKGARGTLHIGHARRSVYTFALSLKGKKPGKISIHDVPFTVPKDTSLNTSRYKKLFHKV